MKKKSLALIILALFVCGSLASQVPGRHAGVLPETSVPAARYHPTMVFDAARGTTVLFGGMTFSGEYLRDTWIWNGSLWEKANDVGPSARFGHAVTYDSRRKKVVLFGGLARTGADGKPFGLGDTWEWNGKSWSQKATSGPAPRTGHQLAYDSRRDRIVLFGGADFTNRSNLGDTWEWDGDRWTRISSSGPAARFFHLMSYDAARGKVVLFGGNVAEGQLNLEKMTAGRRGDAWEWDGAQWKQVSSTGPSARDHHAMTFDGARKETILFGGFDGGYLADTWAWNGRWRQVAAAGPPARGGKPGLTYDSWRQRVVLFGGGIGDGSAAAPKAFDDTWEWNGRRWVHAVPLEQTKSKRVKVSEAVILAERVISTRDVFASAFTPGGETVYFTKSTLDRSQLTIMISHNKNGQWMPPVVAEFSGKYRDLDPFVTPDGSRLYFNSDRPVAGKPVVKDTNIWVMNKTKSGWTQPEYVPASINSEHADFYVTATYRGNLYFASTRPGGKGGVDIYLSKLVKGRYSEPEGLVAINTEYADSNPYISPDERFLLFVSNRPGGYGMDDLYISYNKNGTWTTPENLGSTVNTADAEFCPFFLPSKRLFFFSRSYFINEKRVGEDIYSVDPRALHLMATGRS